jgi:hypothetical protein
MPRPSRYTYDRHAARYRGADGRYVSRVAVRAEIDRELTAIGRDMGTLANQLRARTIDLETWTLRMREAVKNLQLTSTAAAKGGWAQMDPAAYGRAGQRIREQYGYLERFATEIRDGAPLDGRFLQRVQLYAENGRVVFMATERAEMTLRGYTEARSVLRPAEHCQQCADEAAAGWRPAGEVTPIGSRTCLSRCKCGMAYRNPDTGEVAA